MTPFAISTCSVSLSCMFCKDSDNSGQRSSGTGTFSSSLYSVSHTGSCVLVAKALEERSSVELFYHMKCKKDVQKLENSVKLILTITDFSLCTVRPLYDKAKFTSGQNELNPAF